MFHVLNRDGRELMVTEDYGRAKNKADNEFKIEGTHAAIEERRLVYTTQTLASLLRESIVNEGT